MTDLFNKIIDPHLHLFNLQKGDYAWLKPQNPPFWSDKHLINKNFVEADVLLPTPNQLSGFVHIEAGFDNQQPWREIDWLEQHCSLPFKSVAFADLTAISFANHINQLKQRKSVVGIRHILDDQAEEILCSPLIHQHISLLAQAELSFDAQLSLTDDQAVKQLVKLAKQHKGVRLIINHAGWTLANNNINEQKQWKLNLQKLAGCENIAIKLSGWEMLDRAWQPQQIATVIQECITTFSDTRVMLASNFPLCLFSMSYAELWKVYSETSAITDQSFKKISFSNAANWYQF
jgi:predicted TIM-barrel fold metal-dependent hydrolase